MALLIALTVAVGATAVAATPDNVYIKVTGKSDVGSWTNVPVYRVNVNDDVDFFWGVSGCPTGVTPGFGNIPYESNGWTFGASGIADRNPELITGGGPCAWMSQGQAHWRHAGGYGAYFASPVKYTNPGAYLVTFGYNTCLSQPPGAPTCATFQQNKACAVVLVGPAAQPPLTPPACVRGNKDRLQVLVPGENAAPGTIAGKTGTPHDQTMGIPFTVTVNVTGSGWSIGSSDPSHRDDAITITTNAPNAVISPPGGRKLVGGTASFAVTFNLPGVYTITATDNDNNPATPQANVAPGTSAPITVLGATIGRFAAFDNCTTTNCTASDWSPITPATVPISTKVAGSSFTLTLAALHDNSGQIQVMSQFTGSVTVELLDAHDNSGAMDGNGCRASWGPVMASTTATLATGDNGIKTVSFSGVNDAYKVVRVRVTDSANSITSCSTDAFAIRPATLTLAATDTSRTTAGTARTLNTTAANGTPIHNAGQPFTLTVTAKNATGVVTPNYSGNPEPGALSVILPGGGVAGVLATGSWAGSGAGVMTTNTASYSEVGSIRARLVDKHFADVDAADSSKAQRYITSRVANMGRFVPDHFVATLNNPQLKTGCVAGGFTYVGQSFKFATVPVIALTAENGANATTQNYTAGLFRLAVGGSSISGRTYSASSAPAGVILDAGGMPTTGDPVLTDDGGGQATVTFGDGGVGLAYTHKQPVAPFSSLIDLSVLIRDQDGVGVTVVNGSVHDATKPVVFHDIDFASGNTFRYGRVVLKDAAGSELLALPVPTVAQYYKSTSAGFVPNADDVCTHNVSVTLGDFQPYPGNTLQSGDTTATLYQLNDPARPASLGGGDFGLTLSAPGPGHQGTVEVTAKVPHWLRFDWDDDGTADNPSARAAFGVHAGSPHTIYQREVIGP